MNIDSVNRQLELLIVLSALGVIVLIVLLAIVQAWKGSPRQKHAMDRVDQSIELQKQSLKNQEEMIRLLRKTAGEP